jgi:signal transduction histidine kinase
VNGLPSLFSFNHLSLRNRLILGFGLPIALFIVVIMIGLITSRSIQAEFQTVSDVDLPVVATLEELKFAGSRLISSTNEFVLDENLGIEGEEAEAEEGEGEDTEASELEEIAEAITELETAFAAYETLTAAQGASARTSELDAALQTLIDLSNEVVALQSAEAALEEVFEIREELEEAEIEFLQIIKTVLEQEQAELDAQQAAVATVVELFTFFSVVLALVSLLLASALVYGIFRSITQPLKQLNAAAASLSAGQITVRANLDTNDEIGRVAQTFDQMAARIETLVTDLKARVTEAQTARERAERSDQVKSAFLASMSHELRTPLNAVINFTRFVVDGDVGPVNEQQVELLDEVVGSGKHLLNLINDVLDMSKIEAGSLTLFVEDNVNLTELVNNTVSTGRGLLMEKPVILKAEIEPDLPLLRADKQRIYQILLNIMSNACKFTDEGEIKVRAHREGQDILISVADTGPGIALEDQAMVFEPFTQTSAGLRQGGGTGLGMPIAKRLAEVHGGRLWLESEYGKGATFYVALPVSSQVLTPSLA